MRTCRKCGAFYADDSLAFCLADGTPLLDVDPHSESWDEGTRFVEEAEKALARRTRRLKWRRVTMLVTTMLVTTVVVCVVVVNSIIYLKPRPDAPAGPDTNAAANESPPAGNESPSTPTRTPTPACSAGGESREREAIIGKFGDGWRRKITDERDEVIARHRPARVENANGRSGAAAVEATLVPDTDPVRYEISFPRACAARVRARYAWKVSIFSPTPTGQDVRHVDEPGEKTFACVKAGAVWDCRQAESSGNVSSPRRVTFRRRGALQSESFSRITWRRTSCPSKKVQPPPSSGSPASESSASTTTGGGAKSPPSATTNIR